MDARLYSDQELCAFISQLSVDQFDRLVMDLDLGQLFYDHISSCPNQSCVRVFEESDKATIALITKEEEALSDEEKWKQDLLRRQTIDLLKSKGIIH